MTGMNDAEFCASLLNRMFRCIDNGIYEDAATLFTESAAYRTPRGEILGRAAILAALQARPENQVTRHVISTFASARREGNEIQGAAYLQMYRAIAEKPSGTIPLPPLEAIADVECTFEHEGDSWRIARIAVLPALAG